ncbi:MAG: protein kinase, partial [Candidatus Acidoferrales bacterium]
IKPSNILLSRTPQGKDLAKVLDFGVAKIKEDSTLLHGATSLTGTGRVLGTPAYMSPEQARGARSDQLDGRTDLYSLGVVLYEMLTGRPPFTANTPVALMLAHMQSTPSDPGTLRPDLPTTLVKLVLRALEKDPNQRFPSAENMREALERLAEDRTLRLTSLPSALEEAVSPEPLSQGQIPLPATLPSPPGNKLAALLGRAIPAPGQSSSSRWVYAAVIGVVALALVVSAVLFQRRSTPASSVETPPPTSVTEPAPQEGSVPPGDVTPGTTTPSPIVETREKQTTRSNTEEIEKLLQQASQAMDRGRYDEAIRAYQAILDLDVNHAEAQLGLRRARRAQAAEEQVLRRPRNQ